jgi:two-component system chemotaxis response regulator CheB
MKPVRILVVDDSVVIRKLLSDTLSKEATFEVVGTAGDGRVALAKISQLHPDLITLDIEMPVMNGLETLAEIRKSDRKIPVIMFSTLTERGSERQTTRRSRATPAARRWRSSRFARS